MAKKDTTYRYSGPLSGVTLAPSPDSGGADAVGREVMLHPNSEVPLPADNDYVKTLVAQGFLTEIPTVESPNEIPPDPPLLKGGAKNKEATSGS